MLCPRCAHDKTTVVGTVKGAINTRQRRCPECGYVWKTRELPVWDTCPSGYKEYLESLFKNEENETKGQS